MTQSSMPTLTPENAKRDYVGERKEKGESGSWRIKSLAGGICSGLNLGNRELREGLKGGLNGHVFTNGESEEKMMRT